MGKHFNTFIIIFSIVNILFPLVAISIANGKGRKDWTGKIFISIFLGLGWLSAILALLAKPNYRVQNQLKKLDAAFEVDNKLPEWIQKSLIKLQKTPNGDFDFGRINIMEQLSRSNCNSPSILNTLRAVEAAFPEEYISILANLARATLESTTSHVCIACQKESIEGVKFGVVFMKNEGESSYRSGAEVITTARYSNFTPVAMWACKECLCSRTGNPNAPLNDMVRKAKPDEIFRTEIYNQVWNLHGKDWTYWPLNGAVALYSTNLQNKNAHR